jgi:hypothetical protein
MDQYCRLNKSRRKIHPLKFAAMSDDEVLLKQMLAARQKLTARALSPDEQAVFFRATQHYTREFVGLWAWRYAVKVRRGATHTTWLRLSELCKWAGCSQRE